MNRPKVIGASTPRRYGDKQLEQFLPSGPRAQFALRTVQEDYPSLTTPRLARRAAARTVSVALSGLKGM